MRTLRSLLNDELNLLAFCQVFETVTLNGGEMDERVRSTFALDEAEAFVTIEPLYCALFFPHPIMAIFRRDDSLSPAGRG